MPRTSDLADALRIPPGSRVRLSRRDAGETYGWDKPTATPATQNLVIA